MALLDALTRVGQDPEMAQGTFSRQVQPAGKSLRRIPSKEELLTALNTPGGSIYANQNLGITSLQDVRKLLEQLDTTTGRGPAVQPLGPPPRRPLPGVQPPVQNTQSLLAGLDVTAGRGPAVQPLGPPTTTQQPTAVAGGTAFVWPDGRPVTAQEASDPSITMEQRRTWKRRG